MRKKMIKTFCCTVSALTVTVAVFGTASAASVSVNDKCGGKNTAVANVQSELFIRDAASDGGKVLGYLPSAAGVIVESMNADWTKIRSGNISGYVKTEYLAFGEKAEQLKNVYGVLGAVASWNDVKIFSDYEDTSSVIGTINEGEGFEVLGSTDNWVEVQLADGNTAYVAAEDVEMTPVLDTAVSTEEYAAPASGQSQASAEDASAEYQDDAAEQEYLPDDTASESDGTYADVYDDAVYDGTGVNEEYTETETYDTAETDADWDLAYTETESQSSDSLTETEADDTVYEPETEDYTEPETEDYVEAEEWDENDGLTGDEYIDPETDPSDDSSDGSSSSSLNQSDVDLLAALIYCEAGNQSMEGKIAVGQVVMNRVASGSFAGSVHDVIYESGQFTPAMSGWLDQVLASGETPSDCYDAAVAAMNGEGTVGDALYFNGGSGKGQQIGDHQFY